MSRSRPVRAGNAYVEISTKSNVQQGLAKIEGQLRGLSTSVASVGRRMATMGAAGVAAAGAMLAPLGAAIVRFGSFGDQVHKMSARTGVAAEVLSELGFAAEQSGSSIDAVGNALFRMRRRVANAATESGPAVRALKELGLAAEELTKLSPDDQMLVIADALGRVGNESLAAQFAFEIFGDGAKGLLPLLSEGAAGMRALMHEARELGLTLSTEQAAAAAEYADAMNRLKRSADGVTMAIGSALAPALTVALGAVTDWIVATSGWVRENQQLVLEITKGIGVAAAFAAGLAAAGLAVVAVGSVIGGVATIFGALAGAITLVGSIVAGAAAAITGLGAAIAFLASPIGIAAVVLGGFAAAVTALAIANFQASGEMTEAWNNIGSALREVWQIAQEVFGGIMEALQTGDWATAGQIAMEGLKAAFLTVFAEIEHAFMRFMTRIVRAGLEIPAKMLDIVATGGLALLRDGTSADPLLDSLEDWMTRESTELVASRREAAAGARDRVRELSGQASGRRQARDADLRWEEAGRNFRPIDSDAPVLSDIRGEQERLRQQDRQIRDQQISVAAFERGVSSFERATQEAERYRRASPQERIVIDQQRATAAAAAEMREATRDLAQANRRAEAARRAGDADEEKKQRDLATRAARDMDRAAVTAAEANSRAAELTAQELKRSLESSFGVTGGFGGAGLENMPGLFRESTGEAEKQTEIQRLMLVVMRQVERHLRDQDPLAFT